MLTPREIVTNLLEKEVEIGHTQYVSLIREMSKSESALFSALLTARGSLTFILSTALLKKFMEESRDTSVTDDNLVESIRSFVENEEKIMIQNLYSVESNNDLARAVYSLKREVTAKILPLLRDIMKTLEKG